MAAIFVVSQAGLAPGQGLVDALPPSAPLTIIAHVDVMPPHLDAGRRALIEYVRAVRSEQGAEHIDLVQEVFPNHFDLLEVWKDQASYTAHLSGSAWLRMRKAMNALLGSPLNERVGTVIAP